MNFDENWVEIVSILLLALGFIVAMLITNPLLTYIAVFFSGFVAARIFHIRRRKEPIFPFMLIILGLLVGYFLGSFWASRLCVVIFFALGFGLSYYMHMKKILVIFKSERFLK